MIGQEDFILIDTNVLVEVLRDKDKGRRIAETSLSKRAERPLIVGQAFVPDASKTSGRQA